MFDLFSQDQPITEQRLQSSLPSSYDRRAVISQCKLYRYTLEHIWDETRPKVMFLMLNPSTADATKDDPTITRCVGFAKSWGYGGLLIGNLFAYRSTDPKALLLPRDPFGDLNEYHLREMAKNADKIVCAWGNGPILKKLTPRINVKTLSKELYCLELSIEGIPKHPLYLSKSTELKKYHQFIKR